MDFYKIKESSAKNGVTVIYPDFKVCRSDDLMIRGKSFYAIWDPEKNLWSTDEYDVQRLVDQELWQYKEEASKRIHGSIYVKLMSDFSSRSWGEFKSYVGQLSDNAHQLDEKLTFANSVITKEDYVSLKLPYSLEKGDISAYDKIIGTLYSEEERAKIEWAIGAVISGDARYIQKFLVLYGEAGAGKSTILNIIQKLFEGYYTTFEAKALTSSSNAFSTEVFKTNPLVAIQHDGDLSKIEDNTKLNSIVSHEYMTMNEKYKPSYMARTNCFLFMATNRPVKITDAKSGIIRRLIDVKPSGNKLPPKEYQMLMSQIDFELGAIAQHCLDTYLSMGKNYYSDYRPVNMILQTDVFFNFVEANYMIFKADDGVSLSQAYDMYKTYCTETLVEYKLAKYKFREELKNYFRNFDDITRVNGKQIRSYYSGFITEKFTNEEIKDVEKPLNLTLDSQDSTFDKIARMYKAQYAKDDDTPSNAWDYVNTRLKDIDTTKVHYVMVPKNHIVIDFDLKDSTGEKSTELNLEAASKWPPTYAEFSKGGHGIHLHYIYNGDVDKLARVYEPGIEIKVFNGKSSLRRRLSKCNTLDISTISGGLPLKGERMVNQETIKNETHLRNLIIKGLKKEIWPNTAPSVSYIKQMLDEAYASGIVYDVSDLYTDVFNFALDSTHQSEACLKMVRDMHFASENESKPIEDNYDDKPISIFDLEVYPNLFVCCWKFDGDDEPVHKWINPSPDQTRYLINKGKLVGFNNRKYDNHILYCHAFREYTNEQLYNASQKIINKQPNCFVREAYNLSYTDVYDFAAPVNKMSLKKWEIELGIHHQEMSIPWNQPVPEELWDKVADYCANDVLATEAVFHHLHADWVARKILAKLSGLTVNHTTNQHSTKIIFGDDPNPQSQFNIPDLSKEFPGYEFSFGKSSYMGEDPKEGGYVYSEPGMYGDVELYDIMSMHPTTIEVLNLFGPKYTARFSEIKKSRIYVKHRELDKAKHMMDGKLVEFFDDEEAINGGLATALKGVINSVYGLTTAHHDNKFKDPRNKDNVVAKRGALFMIKLKHAVQDMGYTVAHIKTDSIKIPNADSKIREFVMDFGKQYGYTFEHEATYEKLCLINKAVYIAKEKDKIDSDGNVIKGKWTATGAQFAHPYIFKTLFTKEPLEFRDLCETKLTTSAFYLDMNEDLAEDKHNYIFVGKAGSFCPIKSGCGGGLLYYGKNDKYNSATGTKGYRWLESEAVKLMGKENDIDMQYFRDLAESSISDIERYGDFEWFSSDEPYIGPYDPHILPF